MSGQEAITLGGVVIVLFMLEIFVFGWVFVDEPVLQQLTDAIGMIVTIR